MAPKVDDRLKQRLDLRGGDLRQSALEDERDATAGGLLAQVRWSGHSAAHANLDMAQKPVPHVRAAVEVDNNTVRLDLERGYHDAVAGRGGLTFLIDDLLILFGAGREIAVRFERQDGSKREHAMREPLLGFEVADEFTASALGHGFVGKLNAGRGEIGLDAGGGRLLAYGEHLCRGRRDRKASKRKDKCGRKEARTFPNEMSVRCESHGRIL